MSRDTAVENAYNKKIIWRYLKVFKNPDDAFVITRHESIEFLTEIMEDDYLRTDFFKRLKIKKLTEEKYGRRKQQEK
jgi:hypothetical protein